MDETHTQDRKCRPLYTKTGNTLIDVSTQNRYQTLSDPIAETPTRREPVYIRSPPTPIEEQVSKRHCDDAEDMVNSDVDKSPHIWEIIMNTDPKLDTATPAGPETTSADNLEIPVQTATVSC